MVAAKPKSESTAAAHHHATPSAVSPRASEAKPFPTTVSEKPSKALAIEKIALVSQIFGFGAFEPITTDQLVPGRPLLLYAEVVDFDSRYTSGRFETILQAQVALETPTGSTITKFDFDPIVDQCGTKRTDFYSHFTFTLPESLTEGRYVLRLRLKDELSGQQAEKAIDFVVSQLPQQL